jgi:hypothetical protein
MYSLSQTRLPTLHNRVVGLIHFITGMTGGALFTLSIAQVFKRLEHGLLLTPELMMTGILMLMGWLIVMHSTKLLSLATRQCGEGIRVELGNANKAAQNVSLGVIAIMLLLGGQSLNIPVLASGFIIMGIVIWVVGSIAGYLRFKGWYVG